jgi:hypothetical protein
MSKGFCWETPARFHQRIGNSGPTSQIAGHALVKAKRDGNILGFTLARAGGPR